MGSHIEALRHQGGVTQGEKIPLGMDRTAGRRGERLAHSAVDVSHIHFPVGNLRGLGKIEEVPAVRQEPRLAVRRLARIRLLEIRDSARLTASGGDEVQHRTRGGSEHDHPLGAPTAAACPLGVGHRQGCAACQ